MATIRSTEATPRTVGAIGDYLIDNENRIYKCIAINTYPIHDGATMLEPETEYVWKFIGMDTSEATSVQADWNENDSSSPAYILNKPESLGGGVTWFAASGYRNSLSVKLGKNWESGTSVTGTEIINAFENGICRVNVTYISCCGTEYPTGTIIAYSSSGDNIRCYISIGIDSCRTGDIAK